MRSTQTVTDDNGIPNKSFSDLSDVKRANDDLEAEIERL